MASDFDCRVSAVLNLAMPAAERAAGHPLLPTERRAVVKVVRESLLRGDSRSFESLLRPPVASSPVTETTPATPAVEPSKDSATAGRVRAELVRASRVGRLLLGRGLTEEEQDDLEATIRERFAATAALAESAVAGGGSHTAGRHSFGRAVMEGRLGAPATSPGIAPPRLRTAGEIAESVRVDGLTDRTPRQLAALTSEEFHRGMRDYAQKIPFGAECLGG